MKHLYIVRHGQTEWNVEQRMQGRLDSPLTEVGRVQANTHGNTIKRLGGIDALWASPAGRTMETAHIINSHTKTRIDYADQLVERDCGHWSGLTITELEEQFPEEWSARSRDPYGHRPPAGENLQDMLERVHEFLDELFAFEWSALALVTHGVMSKVILKYFLGLTDIECARVRHPNELLYRLTFHADAIDTHHFVNGGEARDGLLRAEPELDSHPSGR